MNSRVISRRPGWVEFYIRKVGIGFFVVVGVGMTRRLEIQMPVACHKYMDVELQVATLKIWISMARKGIFVYLCTCFFSLHAQM